LLYTRLEFKQSQSLVITPQLQQAIKLLQLSNLDLLSFVEREIEQNPLIDWADGAAGREDADSPNGAADASGVDASSGEPTQISGAENADSKDIGSEDSERVAMADFGDHAEDAPATAPASYETLSHRSPANGFSDDSQSRIEELTPQQTSLRDHLRQQLHIEIAGPAERLIGDHLIDLIDDTGYLRGSTDEIADRLGVPESMVNTVLAALQSLAPAGVGARSLGECLALQLEEQNRLDPAIQALLDNLDLLGNHDYAAIRALCGVDDEDLADMIAEIRTLNPRPGSGFGTASIEAVIPDIIVKKRRAGGWDILLNDETLPRVLVNHQFYSAAKRQIRSEKDKVYLQECMTTANWLARSLDQRRQTMIKVAREIVRQQDGFLEHGVRSLRPLALKDVAERIEMHESTVSRVTSNKYMQTPRGTFELKYFFTSAISSAGPGDAHSSEAVKHRIKELIDNESPRKVLSDDKIVAILKDDGIDIARRTVAKYREALRIPSSVHRRRNKKAACNSPMASAGR